MGQYTGYGKLLLLMIIAVGQKSNKCNQSSLKRKPYPIDMAKSYAYYKKIPSLKRGLAFQLD
jgi:hypothetical protein